MFMFEIHIYSLSLLITPNCSLFFPLYFFANSFDKIQIIDKTFFISLLYIVLHMVLVHRILLIFLSQLEYWIHEYLATFPWLHPNIFVKYQYTSVL